MSRIIALIFATYIATVTALTPEENLAMHILRSARTYPDHRRSLGECPHNLTHALSFIDPSSLSTESVAACGDILDVMGTGDSCPSNYCDCVVPAGEQLTSIMSCDDISNWFEEEALDECMGMKCTQVTCSQGKKKNCGKDDFAHCMWKKKNKKGEKCFEAPTLAEDTGECSGKKKNKCVAAGNNCIFDKKNRQCRFDSCVEHSAAGKKGCEYFSSCKYKKKKGECTGEKNKSLKYI